MFSILVVILCSVYLNQAAILQCDFESVCNDFLIDSNWGFTDGLHPEGMDHDHTLNTSSGHYLFYDPQGGSRFQIAQIKIKDWLLPSTDRAICFQMWYYTPRFLFPFNVQLVQGDDERLTRIAASIKGKDPSINDWTLVNVTLPSDKLKLYIRLNVTDKSLVFDDLSIDYCDGPRPLPPKILYECDFESSCSNDFVSLPNYPYQWSILKASDAVKIESQAPAIDYTFGNASGHYAVMPNSKLIDAGKVGYLHLQQELNITSEESYCLNFQYYGYGSSYSANLNVYLWISDETEIIQTIWPYRDFSQYTYTNGKWTWSIINLPVGQYTLLFRVSNGDSTRRAFALDDISITSCAYPSTERSPYYSLLSFSCAFDNLTMCDMTNGDSIVVPKFNFTVFTGDTVPNRELGPTRDHTTNSTTGGFLYWDRQLPFTTSDNGRVHPSATIEQNYGMCIKFAYYVKSQAVNRNSTWLSVSVGGCYAASLWWQTLDDSQGWQTVTVPVLKFACAGTFYFDVSQREPIPVSVALDDIEIDQCRSFEPTTTTSTSTSTTTTTTTTQTTTTTTPQTTSTSTSLPTTTSTTLSSSSTTTQTPMTTTLSTTTTTPNDAHRLFSSSAYHLLLIYFLSRIFM